MAQTGLPSESNGGVIPPSAMPLISPSALLHAHLSQSPSVRPSNRLLTEPRPINLNTSSLTYVNGSSLVRIGDTALVCGVRAEILPIHEIANYRVTKPQISPTSAQPLDEDEDYTEITANNLLVPNLELSTGCSPKHIPGGPPSIEAQSLSQRLLSLLHTSKTIRTSDLQIYYTPLREADDEEQEKGPQLKAYWTLYIDILCISYGGSIFDAAWLALYAALRDTVLPKAWWDIDLSHVLCSPETTDARRLNLRGSPVPLSFGVFVPEKLLRKSDQPENWILRDPDAFEEECCEERGTITVDTRPDEKGFEFVKIEKSGGEGVGTTELMQLLKQAKRRWFEWQEVLATARVGHL